MLTLRPYQHDAIAAIYAYFDRKSGHPLIVIPTAGGKSLVMAAFIAGVVKAWPDQRILIVTHVRELIAQNHAELIDLWPQAPAGVYSAGLGRRDAAASILFAGIQSIHRRAGELGHRDLVLVDEAHLIPGASSATYRRFLKELLAINPKLKIIGFTATPFRLDSGMLHEGEHALFTDVAFDVSVSALIEDGYLCPLVSKAPNTKLNVDGVATRGGEFIAADLQKAVDRDSITQAAIDELVRYGESRRSWLAFCSGVDHAKHVAAAIRERGYSCATIFGDTPRDERDEIIGAFKRGEIRALASMGVLTTGFNAPAVDLIAMLRPTKSAGLYVQMAGRGTRLSAGKENCLVLDFAGNVARHGPIDLVRPRKPGAGDGDAPTKVCPACDSILAISVMACPDCGHVFPAREVRIAPSASTQEILSARNAQWLDVSEVFYSRHEKPGRAPSLRVDYRCGLVTHSEWVCLEHEGYARSKAHAWWRQRTAGAQPPATVNGALRLASSLQRPTGIFVRPSGRYTEVVNHRFGPCVIASTTSAPSVGASRGSTAGSTPISRAAIPLATRATENSAAGTARSSFTGGAA